MCLEQEHPAQPVHSPVGAKLAAAPADVAPSPHRQQRPVGIVPACCCDTRSSPGAGSCDLGRPSAVLTPGSPQEPGRAGAALQGAQRGPPGQRHVGAAALPGALDAGGRGLLPGAPGQVAAGHGHRQGVPAALLQRGPRVQVRSLQVQARALGAGPKP